MKRWRELGIDPPIEPPSKPLLELSRRIT